MNKVEVHVGLSPYDSYVLLDGKKLECVYGVELVYNVEMDRPSIKIELVGDIHITAKDADVLTVKRRDEQ